MKKKIVHLQVLPILSGVQRITLNIYRKLDPDIYEKYLICAKPSGDIAPSLISECKKIGVTVIELTELRREIGFQDIKVFFNLLRIFREHKFDIIHTHSSKTGFLGRIAGKLSGCKRVIHTVHGISFHAFENPVKRILYQILEMVAGLFNDKIVLVNKYYRSKFKFIPARKLMTIYNGIDFDELKPKVDRKDDLIRLISVGRLDFPKSPLDLLKAFEVVLDKKRNIELVIIGDGEYYNSLKEYIKFKDMERTVKLLGWRNDVTELLAESDIFISSPIYEAFGLVFCEAGYTGLPVISTNVEGIPEVVVHGETGILVDPRDPKAMADAISYLAENSTVRAEMGRKGHQHVIEYFGLNRFIKEYTELYELL